MPVIKVSHRNAFTLIELLIVVGIIGTLASVTIVAISPTKQLNAAKDAARLSQIKQVKNALDQYLIDNGSYPNAGLIPNDVTSPKPICKAGVTGDATCVNMDALVPTYIVGLPQDPQETAANYTGYRIAINNGRADVTDPYLMYGKVITNGLAGYWKMDELSGTSTVDSSNNANNGTLVNSPAWAVGKFGNGLSFNGTSSYVNVPANTSLNMTTGVTFTAWFKTSSTPNYQNILMKGTPREYGMFLVPNSTNLIYITLLGVTGDIQPGISKSWTQNIWNHIALTYDKINVIVYLNGTEVYRTPATTNITAANTLLTIGGETTAYPFAGLLDDVRIYNRGLSATEIQLIATGNG